MDEPTRKQVFLESLDRCSDAPEFIPAFYRRFLATSETVRAKFFETDFERQNEMLLNSLRLAAGATSGERDSLRELRERAESHDRYHLNIKPSLYEFWLNSVIETAAEFDEKWNQATEEAWRTILGHVIHFMTTHY